MKNTRTIAGLLILTAVAPSCLGGSKAPSKSFPPPIPAWQTQQRVPTSSNLRGLVFANLGVGIVVGEDGTIFRTGDGGFSWLQLDFTPANRTGNMAAVAGLNKKVVAVGSDAGGGKDWTSNDTLTWTTANAPGSNADYTDVAMTTAGIAPDNPVDIYRLRRDGKVHFTLAGGGDNFPGGTTAAFDNANGFTNILPVPGFAGTTYVVGDIAGVGKIYDTSTATFGTLPRAATTFRRIVQAPNGQPFACGDDNAGPPKGMVVYITDRTKPDLWSEVTNNPGNLPSLRAIHFPHVVYGYVVGNGGTIYRMFYDGANWQWTDLNPAPKVTTEDLYGVYFADADTGWAVGNNGTVIKILNATQVTHSVVKLSGGTPLINWNAMSFSDDGVRGIAVGNDTGNAAKIYRTTNGGSTWTAMALPGGLTTQILNGVSVPRSNANGTAAYICGNSGVLYRNTDVWGTGVWADPGFTGTSGGHTYRAVHFPIDGAKGVLAGNNGTTPLLLYTNDGVNWLATTGQTLPASPGQYSSISSNPAGTKVFASGNGRVSFSTDLANGWTAWGDVTTTGLAAYTSSVIQSPDDTFFTAMLATDNGNVYRLTAGGSWSVQAGSPWGAELPIGLGYQGDLGVGGLNGMIATNAGKLFTTIDGGVNWTQTFPHTKAKPRTIWMSPTVSGLGYAGCDDGVILKTLSSGQ